MLDRQEIFSLKRQFVLHALRKHDKRASGFATWLPSFYSVPSTLALPRVGGLNGAGDLLASLFPPVMGDGAGTAGCQSMNFCPYVPLKVSFEGLAMSVDFGVIDNQIAFDAIISAVRRQAQPSRNLQHGR